MKNSEINIDLGDMKEFFVHHLNKIYTAKTLLVTELPELLTTAHFSDLQDTIQETIKDVKQQIERMDKIYDVLSIAYSNIESNGLKGLIEDSFDEIKTRSNNPELRDMSIIFYLHCIESMEMASFQILEMASVKLKNVQVKELIKRNYEDAKADRTLFLILSAKYMATVC